MCWFIFTTRLDNYTNKHLKETIYRMAIFDGYEMR